jgi:hypothetical protein
MRVVYIVYIWVGMGVGVRACVSSRVQGQYERSCMYMCVWVGWECVRACVSFITYKGCMCMYMCVWVG